MSVDLLRWQCIPIAAPLFLFAQCIRNGTVSGSEDAAFQIVEDFRLTSCGKSSSRLKSNRIWNQNDIETAVAVVDRFFRELGMQPPAGVCLRHFTEHCLDTRRAQWVGLVGGISAHTAVNALRKIIPTVSDEHLKAVEQEFNRGLDRLRMVPGGAAAVAACGVSPMAPGDLKRQLAAFAGHGQLQQQSAESTSSAGSCTGSSEEPVTGATEVLPLLEVCPCS